MSLKFNPARNLFGLVTNSTFSFHSHVDTVIKKVQKRSSKQACLSTTKGGWKKKPLRKVFLDTQRSIQYYAAPAWQPWHTTRRLERAQNQALHRITDQTASIPLEAIRLESGVQIYKTATKRLLAESREKAYRSIAPQHSRSLALEGKTHQRFCIDSWSEKSKRLETQLPDELPLQSLPSNVHPGLIRNGRGLSNQT